MAVRVCPICDIAECKKHAPKKALPMTDITIPPEVVEAARYAFHNATGPTVADDWHVTIAAALSAWPGMMPVSEVFTAGGDFYRPHLILPLPQEVSDE